MILVAAPSKPFSYTGKGTARRGAIIESYDDEINSLYRSLEDAVNNGIALPVIWTAESSLDYVRSVIHSIMTHAVEDEDDLFQWGCDRYILLHFVTPFLTTSATAYRQPGFKTISYTASEDLQRLKPETFLRVLCTSIPPSKVCHSTFFTSSSQKFRHRHHGMFPK